MGPKKRKRAVWEGTQRRGGPRSMKPEIWSRIPEEIQHHILQFLPVRSLCRFRCVSKSWGATTTPALRAFSPSSSYFVSENKNDKKHLRILNHRKWEKFPLPWRAWVSCLSTSCGLILITSKAYQYYADKSFFVYNPFVPGSARALEGLPVLKDRRIVFAGMQPLQSTVEGNKIAFLVVYVSYSGYDPAALVHVFDSRSWSWVVPGARIPGISITRGEDHEVSLCEGGELLKDERLYFITVSNNNTRCLKRLDLWNPEETCATVATWENLPLNLHQNSLLEVLLQNNPSLIMSQGKFVLVNIIPSQPYGAIGFLYLDEQTGRWEELLNFSMENFRKGVKEKITEVKDLSRFSIRALGIPNSSKVTLFFDDIGWGCILDISTSKWSSSYISWDFQPFYPSFLTF